VSLLCDCIVFALSERDREERVACCCVSSASLDSLPFWYQSRLRSCGHCGADEDLGNMRSGDNVDL